jgi:HSP20 family molecular chaperone IbpA
VTVFETMNTNESITTPAASRVGQTAGRPVFVPAADIYETPAGVLIRCDMPGVAAQDCGGGGVKRVFTSAHAGS